MAKRPKTTTLADQLRTAIKTCGRSRYALSQETGIEQSTLSRFVNGKGGMSLDTADAIAKALGLKLTSDESN